MRRNTAVGRRGRGIRRGGFTLVEVSVALMILAIGLVSILSVITTGLRWAGDIKGKSLALSVARAAMMEPKIGAWETGQKQAFGGFYVTRKATLTGPIYRYEISVYPDNTSTTSLVDLDLKAK